MNEDLEALLRAFDRPEIPPMKKHAFLKRGAEGFSTLASLAADGTLSDQQGCNVLTMLSEMKLEGDQKEYIRIVLSSMKDPRKGVRTVAVGLLLGYARLQAMGSTTLTEELPPTEELQERVSDAVAMGLLTDLDEKAARDFFES